MKFQCARDFIVGFLYSTLLCSALCGIWLLNSWAEWNNYRGNYKMACVLFHHPWVVYAPSERRRERASCIRRSIKETCSRWKMPKAFCLISGVSQWLLLLLKRVMNVDIHFHIKQTLWHPGDERWMLHSMLICSLIKYMMRILFCDFFFLFFILLLMLLLLLWPPTNFYLLICSD